MTEPIKHDNILIQIYHMRIGSNSHHMGGVKGIQSMGCTLSEQEVLFGSNDREEPAGFIP
jgi:hypothetical protein